MKKIINNRLYDTETAKAVGTDATPGNLGDLDYRKETLYLKKTGEFFLHGQGGPNTRYAVSAGQNSWAGGERIEPMALPAAREWAQQHLSADAFAAVFGDVDAADATDGYTLHSIKLTNGTTERLRLAARESGRKIYEVVEEALSQYLK
ncbi:MAG: hypothetical protein VB104_07945 [Candidatus Limiplasma sp.]|nr:hypothetical protein [Candidatus Limiplasma sp.]